MGVDISAAARRYVLELWGQGKLDLMDELVGDDIVLKDPMSESATGKQVLKQRVGEMNKAWADGSYMVHEIIVAGDRAIVRGTWRGRQIGDFFGIKPTNKKVSCEGVELLKFANGKIVEDISYFDVYTMFQQLGALPPVDKLVQQRPQPATTAPV
jgi:steroid delta-isomerase-like uncharacterized protein